MNKRKKTNKNNNKVRNRANNSKSHSSVVQVDYRMPISSKLLLSVYAVIPLCLLIILIDASLLEQSLLNSFLKENPENIAIWTMVFGMPHIVASLITLADKEYLQHYKERLWIPLCLFCVSLYIVPLVFGKTVALALYGLYTMYHVLAQQFGMSLMFLKHKPDWKFHTWKWLSVFAATGLYFVAFYRWQLVDENILGMPALEIINIIAAILIAGGTLMALLIHQQVKPERFSIGNTYLWANVAMIISAYIAAISEYTFFLIAIPRVIHDVTAYIIYSVHDRNRNYEKKHNVIYQALSFLPISPLLLCPIISMLLAYVLIHQNYEVGFVLFYLLALLHYHFESFLWKGENLHRQSIKFS